MDPVQFIYFIFALLVSLTVHEASHALTAYYLGDPTAKMKGRLTLNPIAHLDLFGSLIFILTQRIGWGKPVPINPANFKNPVRDSALTALSGPVSNFIFAFVLTLPLRYLNNFLPDTVLQIFWMIFHVNLFLGIFNLLPFPPLDGASVLGLVVPLKYHRQYQNYLYHGLKYFIIIILIDSFVVDAIFGFSIFGKIMEFLHDGISIILLLGS